jgi:hypothetical protein
MLAGTAAAWLLSRQAYARCRTALLLLVKLSGGVLLTHQRDPSVSCAVSNRV